MNDGIKKTIGNPPEEKVVYSKLKLERSKSESHSLYEMDDKVIKNNQTLSIVEWCFGEEAVRGIRIEELIFHRNTKILVSSRYRGKYNVHLTHFVLL